MEEKEGTGNTEKVQEMEGEDENQQEKRDTERFLKEFPQVKLMLEGHITQLRALADKADKVHKKCSISKVVTNIGGIVSSTLTIVGISLAPVTLGASLALSATGLGLGVTSAAANLTATFVDSSVRSCIEARANQLEVAKIEKEKSVMHVLNNVAKVSFLAKNCVEGGKAIGKSIKAMKLLRAGSAAASRGPGVVNAGKVSLQSGEQVQKVFEGTVTAMSAGARVAGLTLAGLSILIDVASLVKESVDLHKGSKTRSAEDMRQRAQMLEKMLEELEAVRAALTAS